jgi:hypothetical protein
MKMINSIAALALYSLTISLFATANEATAGEYGFYMDAHRSAAVGTPNIVVAALEEGDLHVTPEGQPPFTKTIIERAQNAFARQLNIDCQADEQMNWVAEDAVYEYALSRIDVRLQLQGRSSVTEHLCALSETTAQNIVRNVHYFPTLKPDLVYVQYELVATDGSGNNTRPLAIIQMRDDQIVHFTQLSRSTESMEIVNASM